MENATDALKIAFGLLIFVTAITVLFVMVTHTRVTADATLNYADDTNYYDWVNSSNKNREVTVSDVITSLYRYYNESVAITIKFNDGEEYNFDIKYETDKDGNKIALTDYEEIEKNLGTIIENKLIHTSSRFIEKFTEVPTSGIYEIDERDGSELTLAAGSRKIFITYEEI